MINGKVLALFALASMEVFAQSYSYYYTMRAGRFAGADWELGVGDDPAAADSTRSFNYNGSPGNNHWGNAATLHQFQIGWFAPTNTAFVRVLDAQGVATTTTFSPPSSPLSAAAIWTIPANSFFVSAAGQSSGTPTSVTLSNLSLSSGVSILSGSLPTSIAANQSGNVGGFASLGAPLVINPASAGGSWTLSGTVRFTGLQSQGGVANGSQLQFIMNAVASDVPEASTVSMIGLGLVSVALLAKRRRHSLNNGGETRA